MKLIGFLLIAACLLGAVPVPSSAPYLRLYYHMGLRKAQLEGNLERLQQLSVSAKFAVQREIAHLAYLQTNMRLSKLLQESTACFNSKTNRSKKPLLVITCSIFSTSAAYYDQRIADSSRLMIEARQYDYPKLKQMTGKDFRIRFFQGIDAKRFLKTPVAKIRRGAGSSFIPWANCGGNLGNMAKLWAIVDHKRVCFVVDTGAPISILTQKTAKELGLVLQRGKYGFGTSRMQGKTKTKYYFHLGVAKSVRIGHDIISNLPFSVSDGIYNVIGTDTQRKLGELLFTQAGLEIRSRSKSKCTEPMAYAYQHGIPRGPMLKLVIGGKYQRLMFDSGQTSPLSTNTRKYLGSSKLSTMKTAYIYGEYGQNQKVYEKDIRISRTSKSQKFKVSIEYAPGYLDVIPLHAGFNLLKIYSVELNFDGHKACFLPAG